MAYKIARRHPGQLTYYDPGVGTIPEPWEKTRISERLWPGNRLVLVLNDTWKYNARERYVIPLTAAQTALRDLNRVLEMINRFERLFIRLLRLKLDDSRVFFRLRVVFFNFD